LQENTPECLDTPTGDGINDVNISGSGSNNIEMNVKIKYLRGQRRQYSHRGTIPTENIDEKRGDNTPDRGTIPYDNINTYITTVGLYMLCCL